MRTKCGWRWAERIRRIVDRAGQIFSLGRGGRQQGRARGDRELLSLPGRRARVHLAGRWCSSAPCLSPGLSSSRHPPPDPPPSSPPFPAFSLSLGFNMCVETSSSSLVRPRTLLVGSDLRLTLSPTCPLAASSTFSLARPPARPPAPPHPARSISPPASPPFLAVLPRYWALDDSRVNFTVDRTSLELLWLCRSAAKDRSLRLTVGLPSLPFLQRCVGLWVRRDMPLSFSWLASRPTDPPSLDGTLTGRFRQAHQRPSL